MKIWWIIVVEIQVYDYTLETTYLRHYWQMKGFQMVVELFVRKENLHKNPTLHSTQLPCHF